MNDELLVALREDRGLEYIGQRLGADPDVRLISDGASLASVFLMRVDDDEAVLKIMPVDAPHHRAVSARREMHFYRELAPTIPVSVPQVLDAGDGSGGIWLLLRRYPTVEDATQLGDDAFVSVVRTMARFHLAFWSNTKTLLHDWTWLRQAEPHYDDDLIQSALRAWSHLGSRRELSDTVTVESLGLIEKIISRCDALAGIANALPSTLCHGDFHAANLLIGPGQRILWADWQEVGIGPGTEDLTHFISRARMDGALVPDEKLLSVYRDEIIQVTDLDASELHAAVEAGELLKIVLHWPHYLGWAPVGRVSAILHRTDYLAAKLGVL